MQVPIELPGLFLRFIGVVEVLGALGLVLPGLFRIAQQLTPFAACELVGVIAGATILSAMGLGVAAALRCVPALPESHTWRTCQCVT